MGGSQARARADGGGRDVPESGRIMLTLGLTLKADVFFRRLTAHHPVNTSRSCVQKRQTPLLNYDRNLIL